MGNFSRDPKLQLDKAVPKHYVGVRLQQGVPILDTDWNESEDLRKHELQELFKRFIGDGVPGDNDGFRIQALAGGGVGAIVLQAISPAEGFTSLEIDFGNSTATSILGFLPGNAYAERDGSNPASLTGNASEPFNLSDGQTLTVKANGEAGVTATFQTADFIEIAQATADEVIKVLNNNNLAGAQATKGTGNDFIIKGGGGTVDTAGRILVQGKEALAETDMVYSSQPLYENNSLAAKWDVAVVPAPQEPTTEDRQDIIYIDVWEREVDQKEDDEIVHPAVGVETAIRLRREWAIRVAEGADDLSGITRAPGHEYAMLAKLVRPQVDGKSILEGNIPDLRKRQLTLSDAIISPILVKGELGLDKVNSGLFASMLQSTSSVYQSLLDSDLFLNGGFSGLSAEESIKILRVFQDVRFVAEGGLADASQKKLDNPFATDYLLRLYEKQRDFVDTISPLTAGVAGREDTETFLAEVDTWLEGNGSIPGLRKSVKSDESPNLGNAYDAQIFINSEVGRRIGILPQGLLEILFVSAPGGNINAGTTHEFVYSIRSELNVEETIELALTDTAGVFQFEFKDLAEDPNHPGDKSKATFLMQPSQTTDITFDLIVPGGVPNGAQSRIVLTARSKQNPEEIDFANVEILVIVGSPISAPAALLELALIFPEINLATDVVSIGKASTGSHVQFQLNISHLVDKSVVEEFQFNVEFIGNSSAFEVLGATKLNPFPLPGAIDGGNIVPLPFIMPIGASDSATDDQQSLMVIRLDKTNPVPPEPFFRELHIRVITKLS